MNSVGNVATMAATPASVTRPALSLPPMYRVRSVDLRAADTAVEEPAAATALDSEGATPFDGTSDSDRSSLRRALRSGEPDAADEVSAASEDRATSVMASCFPCLGVSAGSEEPVTTRRPEPARFSSDVRSRASLKKDSLQADQPTN